MSHLIQRHWFPVEWVFTTKHHRQRHQCLKHCRLRRFNNSIEQRHEPRAFSFFLALLKTSWLEGVAVNQTLGDGVAVKVFFFQSKRNLFERKTKPWWNKFMGKLSSLNRRVSKQLPKGGSKQPGVNGANFRPPCVAMEQQWRRLVVEATPIRNAFWLRWNANRIHFSRFNLRCGCDSAFLKWQFHAYWRLLCAPRFWRRFPVGDHPQNVIGSTWLNRKINHFIGTVFSIEAMGFDWQEINHSITHKQTGWAKIPGGYSSLVEKRCESIHLQASGRTLSWFWPSSRIGLWNIA